MADANVQSGTFEELAMPLFASLYNFAHWLTQNREDAEDLVQETYAKALKGFGSFQQGTNFRAWMFKILRNTFLTSRTGLRVSMTVPLEDDEDDDDEAKLPAMSETPESIFLARTDEAMLQQGIGQLAPPFREVLLLADVEEMKYQEIAEAISIPIGTVMSRLSRARKALRQELRKLEPKAKGA
jgi:RNA polymerase sigma-70 factor, ECF subfamily